MPITWRHAVRLSGLFGYGWEAGKAHSHALSPSGLCYHYQSVQAHQVVHSRLRRPLSSRSD
jgi:alpha-D-ribose 1-methylphosphonate 5-triphosphate synthase subunit PhnG